MKTKRKRLTTMEDTIMLVAKYVKNSREQIIKLGQ